MKLHHIGIATRNIDETSRLLEQFGYWGDEIKLDTEQNVYVRFLHHRFNPDLELIGGVNHTSPVNRLLEKNGTCVYHLCYETDDIDREAARLRKQGYVPAGRKTKAVLDGRHVIFLFHTDNCLIELMDGG